MRTATGVMILMFLVVPGTIYGADHCVRPGATGSNDGSDWDNAYTQIPASLVRGDTYYLADGSYGHYTFDDPVSGTQVITLKKATANDHGTGTGWNNIYGDGTADLLQVTVNTGYFDLDGSTGGGPGSWKTGHGIAFSQAAGTDRSFVEHADGVSNVSIRRCSFKEVGDTEQGRYGANGIFSREIYDLLVERCYFENLNGLPFFFRGGSGVIIQYNYTGDVCGCSVWSTDWHCEVLVCHSLSDVHFRWNYLSECPSSGGFVKNSTPVSSDVRIYGNIFRDGYAVNCNTGTCPGWRIFNNTVATGGGAFGGDGAREGWYVYNNIIFRRAPAMPGENGYNLFIEADGGNCNMKAGPGENVTTRYPGNCDLIIEVSDPFVNSAGNMPEDFSLAGAVTGWDGYDVGQLDACDDAKKYNYDILGNERGADGVWDRGAVEYSASSVQHSTFNLQRPKLSSILPNPLPLNRLWEITDIRHISGKTAMRSAIRPGIFMVRTADTGLWQRVVIVK